MEIFLSAIDTIRFTASAVLFTVLVAVLAIASILISPLVLTVLVVQALYKRCRKNGRGQNND